MLPSGSVIFTRKGDKFKGANNCLESDLEMGDILPK